MITKKEITQVDIDKAAKKPAHVTPLDCAKERLLLEAKCSVIRYKRRMARLPPPPIRSTEERLAKEAAWKKGGAS